MDSAFDQKTQRLRLEFAAADDIKSFIDSARRESGFLVTLPVGLTLHASLTVELVAPHRSMTVEARVLQVFDKGFNRFGTALVVDDWYPATPRTGERERRDDTGPVASSADHDADETGPVETSPASSSTLSGADQLEEQRPCASEGEMRGTSPIHAIKEMNPRQRAMLAMRASRTQRKVLVRDRSPQVLQNLLANPQIDSEEVLQIARSSHVVAPILQRIAGDARWSGNQEILATIARHPKTPSLFATRLMPQLRTSDLRSMAKMSSGLREMTRKAALREYMRRTGQRI